MKEGTLVQYFDLDDRLVYGLITKNLGYHQELKCQAVEVVWFDDFNPTVEGIWAIKDPDEAYIEVVSESR
jgi:hypothetical protein